jgi:hypothetical protein
MRIQCPDFEVRTYSLRRIRRVLEELQIRHTGYHPERMENVYLALLKESSRTAHSPRCRPGCAVNVRG